MPGVRPILKQLAVKRIYICQNCSKVLKNSFDTIYCQKCDQLLQEKATKLFKSWRIPF